MLEGIIGPIHQSEILPKPDDTVCNFSGRIVHFADLQREFKVLQGAIVVSQRLRGKCNVFQNRGEIQVGGAKMLCLYFKRFFKVLHGSFIFTQVSQADPVAVVCLGNRHLE